MAVEVLRLGMETGEAIQAANQLLDFRTGPRDLSNLLVLDDTALLVEHAPVYMRLDTAKRVGEMLCVAVGPRAGDDGLLRLPGNLGGTQGSPVLWVSDPFGIDWRVSAAAIALGHPPGKVSGLDHLVELLLAEDMFRRVYKIFTNEVPGRIASPGLWLAGADDEAATFAAALGVAISRLCDPGSGADGPFPALLPSHADGVSLAEDGPLARYRNEVRESVAAASDALGSLTGFGGRFRQGDGRAQAHTVEAGIALTDLRDLVAKLLADNNSAGELTANQRRQVQAGGIRFLAGPEPPSSAQTTRSAAEQRPAYRSIMEAVQGGDTLTLVGRRLTLTERALKRRGSAGYLQEVATCCPPALLDRLAAPPQRLPRGMRAAEARHELGLDEAARAAKALEDLVLTVANREWSPAATSRGEVARIRVALEGVCQALTEHAEAVGGAGNEARGARLTRLGESLIPVLRELALQPLAAESIRPSSGGSEAFEAAHEQAAARLKEWVQHVEANGVLSTPPFATSSMAGTVPYADDDDVAEIRETLLYQPSQEMWQLCAPEDLSALNVDVVPEVVRFAPRLNKDALMGTLPGKEPVWTSSGSYAGLLRLVSLRPRYVRSSWSEEPSAAGSSFGADQPFEGQTFVLDLPFIVGQTADPAPAPVPEPPSVPDPPSEAGPPSMADPPSEAGPPRGAGPSPGAGWSSAADPSSVVEPS